MKNILYSIYSSIQRLLHFKNIGKNSVIKFPYSAWNRNNITIGDNTFINSRSFFAISPKDKNRQVLKIGNNCCIGSDFFVAGVYSITIEDNVLFSDRVFISDHIHSYQHTDIPVIYQGLVYKGSVHIKEGAFIGVNTVIMPGVTIGRNSVIGASSVVIDNVPDYCVATGNPAKILKRFDFDKNCWIKV